MNKQRRKEIDGLIAEVEAIKVFFALNFTTGLGHLIGLQEGVADVLQDIIADEQEAFDNLPEGLQESERGHDMQAAIESLETASAPLADIMTTLEQLSEGFRTSCDEAVGYLDEAKCVQS